MSEKKKLGIIGGMGPKATVYMFDKIVEMTAAKSDRDHIEIFIHNNTMIPDRTMAILHKGKSPVPELVRSAKILQEMGADLLIIPCMTSHHFLNEIQSSVGIPIINAIAETAHYISENYSEVESVGILATSGTIKSGLFQRSLEYQDIVPLVLPDEDQDNFIMSTIYGEKGIKAGFITPQITGQLKAACNRLIENGAGLIIAGCTEIPLALTQKDIPVPLIDVMWVLSTVAIQKCIETGAK